MILRLPLTALAAAVLAVAMPALAGAQTATRIAKFGAWEALTSGAKTAKICYAASAPVRSVPAPKGRGQAYAALTDRPGAKSFDIVSFAAGFPYKKDSTVALVIGTAHFDLYTDGDTAWSRDDKAVDAAMQKGKDMVVKSTPAKGDPVTDSFTLDGFLQARAAIAKACGVK